MEARTKMEGNVANTKDWRRALRRTRIGAGYCAGYNGVRPRGVIGGRDSSVQSQAYRDGKADKKAGRPNRYDEREVMTK